MKRKVYNIETGNLTKDEAEKMIREIIKIMDEKFKAQMSHWPRFNMMKNDW